MAMDYTVNLVFYYLKAGSVWQILFVIQIEYARLQLTYEMFNSIHFRQVTQTDSDFTLPGWRYSSTPVRLI